MDKRMIKVLIVDDSLLFRETMSKGISTDLSIKVVGKAGDPYEARDKIIELAPDVLTLDVEMPKMSGIEFLKKLIPQYPIPVIVVSAVNNSVFEALNAGAVDFVAKPDVRNPDSLGKFIDELILKIKIGSAAKAGNIRSSKSGNGLMEGRMSKSAVNVIAIGASTGGTEAICEVVRELPGDTPGIVIVQHMPPVFTRMYAERLDRTCRMSAREAKDGELIEKGKILVAPGDFHMKVVQGAAGGYAVRCYKGEKVNGHCPSVDVLFDSIASISGSVSESVGIILTGMGNDGAKGLLNMRKKGAYTIGQDENSSVVYGMPMVAQNIGAVMRQVPLGKISDILCRYVLERSK